MIDKVFIILSLGNRRTGNPFEDYSCVELKRRIDNRRRDERLRDSKIKNKGKDFQLSNNRLLKG
ncbi:hypothetical protein DRF65_19495 [Chryseobacterium pennae]|uniref:Uncharacterized protein n=1 Tax=Chryseobacterium pennae TaxID=2258962 RepID=A0A3D9C569_9FLAO|nr:hypothetical protein DRF65_19495 [Chryseobacterium pennae]